MNTVKVTEVSILSLDEYNKYKDNIKLNDWWWLSTPVPFNKCNKYSKEKCDEIIKNCKNIYKDEPEQLQKRVDLYTKLVNKPILHAYLVFDDGSVISQDIDRGDISVRRIIRFESSSIKNGTILLYGNPNDYDEYIVIDEGLAIGWCKEDSWWMSSDDCWINDDYDESLYTFKNSRLKNYCDSYFIKYGDTAIIKED